MLRSYVAVVSPRGLESLIPINAAGMVTLSQPAIRRLGLPGHDSHEVKGTPRDRLAYVTLQLEALDRSHDESAESAAPVLELFQMLREKWLTVDSAAKREILEIVLVNC